MTKSANLLKPADKHIELKPEELRWKCNPDIFQFDSTIDS